MILSYLAAVLAFLLALVVYLARREGQSRMRADKEEEINHAVFKALSAHDRLERDPAYARRVRQSFRRKLLPDLSSGIHKPEGHDQDARTDRPE